MEKEYIIVSDNDCHRYIIPYIKKNEWDKWQDLDPEDEKSWETPDFAKEIDGGIVVFTKYRIE